MSKRPPGTDPQKQPASREQVQDTGRKSTIFFPPPPPGLEVQKEGARVPGAMPSEGTGTNNGAIRNQGLSSHLSGSQYTGSYYGGGSEDGDGDDVDTKLLPIQLLSTLSFRYKDQGRRKAEAIFIPKGVQVNSKKIESLVTETWGLSMPNMIISCDAGSAHPVTLATKALFSTAELILHCLIVLLVVDVVVIVVLDGRFHLLHRRIASDRDLRHLPRQSAAYDSVHRRSKSLHDECLGEPLFM